jgi:parvulin-like peptidyl-prolyl isomerase
MGKIKSSSEDRNETTSKVLSGIWEVVWFILKLCFKIAFGVVFGVIAFAFALGGVKLPNLPDFTSKRRSVKFDPDKYRSNFQNLTLQELLNEFGEQLDQLEQQGKLKPQQQEVIRKIRKFDRSKYDKRLRNLFNDNEIEELLMLILALLGVEVS